MSKKVTVVGECMIELSEKDADVRRGFGGDTLNTSVYIARQVDPAALTVRYVTALRTDSFSQQMPDTWRGENVNTSLAQRMENRLPSLCYIEADNTGKHTFYYWHNEAAARSWLESERSAAICEELANSGYLYLSGISLAILSPTSREELLFLLREYRANGGKVIFDNNYRPCLWASKEETQRMCRQVLECTGIAFLTLDDENALWGQQPVEDVIVRTHDVGVKEVVMKRGADSCLMSITNKGLVGVPAVKLPKEKMINTTAAGDFFNAGYLAVRLTGGSTEDAAGRGYLAASTVIQYRGATIPRETMPA